MEKLFQMNYLENVDNFKNYPELIDYFQKELKEFKISKDTNIHLFVPSATIRNPEHRICHITPKGNKEISIKEHNDKNNQPSQYYIPLKSRLQEKGYDIIKTNFSGDKELADFISAVHYFYVHIFSFV